MTADRHPETLGHAPDAPEQYVQGVQSMSVEQLAEHLRAWADDSDSWIITCAMREAAWRVENGATS